MPREIHPHSGSAPRCRWRLCISLFHAPLDPELARTSSLTPRLMVKKPGCDVPLLPLPSPLSSPKVVRRDCFFWLRVGGDAVGNVHVSPHDEGKDGGVSPFGEAPPKGRRKRGMSACVYCLSPPLDDWGLLFSDNPSTSFQFFLLGKDTPDGAARTESPLHTTRSLDAVSRGYAHPRPCMGAAHTAVPSSCVNDVLLARLGQQCVSLLVLLITRSRHLLAPTNQNNVQNPPARLISRHHLHTPSFAPATAPHAPVDTQKSKRSMSDEGKSPKAASDDDKDDDRRPERKVSRSRSRSRSPRGGKSRSRSPMADRSRSPKRVRRYFTPLPTRVTRTTFGA
jgi:hypothetical protein